MADYGLFIGFGAPVHGREVKSLEVFNEAMQFYSTLQGDGTIESWDVVLLEPHGGDLNGFFLIKGEQAKISSLRVDEQFNRLTTRANLIVEGVGVVGALVGDGLTQGMGMFQEALSELT